MHIKDAREGLSSLVCLAAGAAIVVMSLGYELGTALNMGLGYFPLILGGILVLVGLIMGAGAVGFGAPTQKTHIAVDLRALWALTVVTLAIVAFAALLEPLGLALTCFLVLTLAGIGSRLLRPLEAIATAFVLSAVCVVLFVYLLDLQISAWPW
jgi:hypothetical protein